VGPVTTSTTRDDERCECCKRRLRYRWPQFEPGHESRLEHGARSTRRVSPLADQLAAEVVQVAPWAAAPTFTGVVASWAWAEAQLHLLRRYLDEHGPLDEDGTPRTAMALLSRVEGRLDGLRTQLGLTPLALARLLGALSQVDGERGEQGLEALRRVGAQLRAAADERVLKAGQAEAVAGG
jgi:hypothetical protein